MSAVEATEHRVVFYKSNDLKSWTYLDDFGPANAQEGIWECPDLFPLAVDGNPANTKWVLVVNLNPGSVAGGSGGQYFVGDFNGTTFTSDTTDPVDALPAGTAVGRFNNGTYDGWTPANDPANPAGPWATTPASGTVPGQNQVTGHIGGGLINSFHGGDTPVGTLESPSFTVGADYLNFLVGGGRHPQLPGEQSGNVPPPGYLLFDRFDYPGTLTDAGWQLTGDFQPTRNPSTAGGEFAIGKPINTFEGGTKADGNVGAITSPEFYLTNNNIGFLLGGGNRTDGQLQVELLVNGAPVRTAHRHQLGRPQLEKLGRVAVLRSNCPDPDRRQRYRSVGAPDPGQHGPRFGPGQTAKRRNHGEPGGQWPNGADGHRNGPGTPGLDSVGRQRVPGQPGDHQGGGQQPQRLGTHPGRRVPCCRTRTRCHGWRKIRLAGLGQGLLRHRFLQQHPGRQAGDAGWMNNWDYGQATPTSTWRGTMALPREVVLLTQTPKGPRLRQQAVAQTDTLKNTAAAYTAPAQDIQPGTVNLPISGDMVHIRHPSSPPAPPAPSA